MIHPEVLGAIAPISPSKAIRMGIQGVVVLDVEAKKDGSSGITRLLRSPESLLDQSAIDAISNVNLSPDKVLISRLMPG